jgi:hypothetical protein
MEVTPTLFTADYVGEPGRRTFYLQARTDAATLSFLLEKQQVSVLADRLSRCERSSYMRRPWWTRGDRCASCAAFPLIHPVTRARRRTATV